MDQLRRAGKFIGPSFMLDGVIAVILGVLLAGQREWAFWAGILAAVVLIPVGGFCWSVGAVGDPVRAVFIAGGWILVFAGLVGVGPLSAGRAGWS